jgi:pimeloyl-ACP methyl ester carboxylesterase
MLFESGWITHLHRQLELCSFGSFLERLGERFTVIRYDKPGCGLSDRDGADLSFDGQLTAALAVADAVGADRFRPYGTADDVAEFLAPYVAAGCTAFNLIPQSPHQEQAIAHVAAVKRLLTTP